MHRTLLSLSAFFALFALFALVGCRSPIDCGMYEFDEARQICVCPAGTVEEPGGACIAIDGGPRDGGAGDAAAGDSAADDGSTSEACTASVSETCNGIDDDCDGVPDDGPAASSCPLVAHGAAGCSAGECYAATCTPGYADCNHDVADGCEAELASDIANCGGCGVTCGWACEESDCNNAIRMEVADDFQCARRERGDVVCWGANVVGQLGDGSTINRAVPTPVVGLSSVVDVATGVSHACAVRSDGSVWCWGLNESGELGDGSTTSSLVPVLVPGIASATAVECGNNFSCARLSTGTVQCWGSNTFGQLGNGTVAVALSPVTVMGLSGVFKLVSGGNHVCATRTDETLRCWGWNRDGQLGDGTTVNRSVPVTVSGLTGVAAVAAGAFHTCASTSAGVFCWGGNGAGQLGDGTTTPRLTPRPTPLAGCLPIDLAAGLLTSCVVCDGGVGTCWGEGIGPAPTAISDSPALDRLSVGRDTNICGIRVDRGVSCGTPTMLAPVRGP